MTDPHWASLVAQTLNICLQCRRPRVFNPWVRKILWRREWLPLQYSFLEISMDKGAQWATVHGFQRVGHDWMTNTFTFHDRPTTHITFINEKLRAFPLRLGTKQKCPHSPFLLNTVLEVLVATIRLEKEIKGIHLEWKIKISHYLQKTQYYM